MWKAHAWIYRSNKPFQLQRSEWEYDRHTHTHAHPNEKIAKYSRQSVFGWDFLFASFRLFGDELKKLLDKLSEWMNLDKYHIRWCNEFNISWNNEIHTKCVDCSPLFFCSCCFASNIPSKCECECEYEHFFLHSISCRVVLFVYLLKIHLNFSTCASSVYNVMFSVATGKKKNVSIQQIERSVWYTFFVCASNAPPSQHFVAYDTLMLNARCHSH